MKEREGKGRLFITELFRRHGKEKQDWGAPVDCYELSSRLLWIWIWLPDETMKQYDNKRLLWILLVTNSPMFQVAYPLTDGWH
jgi:hypothetical protein